MRGGGREERERKGAGFSLKKFFFSRFIETELRFTFPISREGQGWERDEREDAEVDDAGMKGFLSGV